MHVHLPLVQKGPLRNYLYGKKERKKEKGKEKRKEKKRKERKRKERKKGEIFYKQASLARAVPLPTTPLT